MKNEELSASPIKKQRSAAGGKANYRVKNRNSLKSLLSWQGHNQNQTKILQQMMAIRRGVAFVWFYETGYLS